MPLPKILKRRFIGTRVEWVDKDPLSNDGDADLNFIFHSSLKSVDTMLLMQRGFVDIVQVLELDLTWRVKVTLEFEGAEPMSKSVVVRGPQFHVCHRFLTFRDNFFVSCRLDPPGAYKLTYFEAECVSL